VLVGSLLCVWEAFQCLLASAGGNAVVGARQIRLGDLQIEHGLAHRIVLGLDNLAGLFGINSLEATNDLPGTAISDLIRF
jgi:hypothetical protein